MTESYKIDDNLPKFRVVDSEGTVSGREDSDSGRMRVISSGVTSHVKHCVSVFPLPHKVHSSSCDRGRSSFQAFDSFDECVDTFLNNPAKILSKDTSDIQRLNEFERGRETRYDVEGDYIDVGRFLDGEPECYGSQSYGVDTPVFVNILLSGGRPARVSQDDINKANESIQNLVYSLERNNFRCKITAIRANECEYAYINVKAYNEQLTPTDIAVVGHSEMLRRIGFRFIEHSGVVSWGYGSGVTTDKSLGQYEHKHSDGDFTIKIYGTVDGETYKEIDTLAEKIVKGEYERGGILETSSDYK